MSLQPTGPRVVGRLLCSRRVGARRRLAGRVGHDRRRALLFRAAQHLALHFGSRRRLRRQAARATRVGREGARGERRAEGGDGATLDGARHRVHPALLAAGLHLDALLRRHDPHRGARAARSSRLRAAHAEAVSDPSARLAARPSLRGAGAALRRPRAARPARGVAPLPRLLRRRRRRARAQLWRDALLRRARVRERPGVVVEAEAGGEVPASRRRGGKGGRAAGRLRSGVAARVARPVRRAHPPGAQRLLPRRSGRRAAGRRVERRGPVGRELSRRVGDRQLSHALSRSSRSQ
mmetsp:Transcript_22735/g.75389  ORF Transcript_22735/g.75389 Transcript_22735/m.75389 type:complete len:294 (+) Transcript_22735:647-1528(+)